MTSRERVVRTLNFKESKAIDLGGMLSTGISCFAYPRLVEALGLSYRRPRVHDIHQMLALPDSDVLDVLDCDVVTVHLDWWTNAFTEDQQWYPFDFGGRLEALVQHPQRFAVLEDGSVTYEDNRGSLIMPPSSFVFNEQHGGQPLDLFSLDAPKESLEEIEAQLRASQFTDEQLDSIESFCRKVRTSTDRAVFFNGVPMGLKYRGGMAAWSMICLTEPDYVKEVHELITTYRIRDYEQLIPRIAPYVDVFMTNSDDQGTQNAPIMPPQTFTDLYVPYYRRMNDAIHQNAPQMKTFLHSCGAIYSLLEAVIASGFDVINPVQWTAGGHSYHEWKDLSRGRLVLWGGGINSQGTLPLGTLEEIACETAEVVKYLRTDGGFVFNSIHNILAEIEPQKVITMYEAAGRSF